MDKVIKAPWSSVKDFSVSRNESLQVLDINGNYYIRCFSGPFAVGCTLSQHDPQDADLVDFETNFLPTANQPTTQAVQTLREVKDLRLNCVAIEGAADANGVCVATCLVPATGEDAGRVIDWGEAWITGANHDDDKITKIKVDMPDGVGGWVEVSSYTDQDSANEGWWLPPKPTTAEVEPLGYYGQLYGGMRLRIEAQCGGTAPFTGRKLKVNLAWGIRDAT